MVQNVYYVPRGFPTDMPHSGRNLLKSQDKLENYLNSLNSIKVLPPGSPETSAADLLVGNERVPVPYTGRGIDQVTKIQLDRDKLKRYLDILKLESASKPDVIKLDEAKVNNYIKMLQDMSVPKESPNNVYYKSRIKLLKSGSPQFLVDESGGKKFQEQVKSHAIDEEGTDVLRLPRAVTTQDYKKEGKKSNMNVIYTEDKASEDYVGDEEYNDEIENDKNEVSNNMDEDQTSYEDEELIAKKRQSRKIGGILRSNYVDLESKIHNEDYQTKKEKYAAVHSEGTANKEIKTATEACYEAKNVASLANSMSPRHVRFLDGKYSQSKRQTNNDNSLLQNKNGSVCFTDPLNLLKDSNLSLQINFSIPLQSTPASNNLGCNLFHTQEVNVVQGVSNTVVSGQGNGLSQTSLIDISDTKNDAGTLESKSESKDQLASNENSAKLTSNSGSQNNTNFQSDSPLTQGKTIQQYNINSNPSGVELQPKPKMAPSDGNLPAQTVIEEVKSLETTNAVKENNLSGNGLPNSQGNSKNGLLNAQDNSNNAFLNGQVGNNSLLNEQGSNHNTNLNDETLKSIPKNLIKNNPTSNVIENIEKLKLNAVGMSNSEAHKSINIEKNITNSNVQVIKDNNNVISQNPQNIQQPSETKTELNNMNAPQMKGETLPSSNENCLVNTNSSEVVTELKNKNLKVGSPVDTGNSIPLEGKGANDAGNENKTSTFKEHQSQPMNSMIPNNGVKQINNLGSDQEVKLSDTSNSKQAELIPPKGKAEDKSPQRIAKANSLDSNPVVHVNDGLYSKTFKLNMRPSSALRKGQSILRIDSTSKQENCERSKIEENNSNDQLHSLKPTNELTNAQNVSPSNILNQVERIILPSTQSADLVKKSVGLTSNNMNQTNNNPALVLHPVFTNSSEVHAVIPKINGIENSFVHEMYPLHDLAEITDIQNTDNLVGGFPHANSNSFVKPKRPPTVNSEYYKNMLMKFRNEEMDSNDIALNGKPNLNEIVKMLSQNFNHMYLDKEALYTIIGKELVRLSDLLKGTDSEVMECSRRFRENINEDANTLHKQMRAQQLPIQKDTIADTAPIFPKAMSQWRDKGSITRKRSVDQCDFEEISNYNEENNQKRYPKISQDVNILFP